MSDLEPAEPLETFLDRIDWRSATPQQISLAVIGRSPVDLYLTGVIAQVFDAKSYFLSLLLSVEFQARIISNLLEAHPRHQRRFFVHIPKSGGTSLTEILQSRGCAVINATEMEPDWQTGRSLIDAVAQICRRCREVTKIYVVGHFRLAMIVEDRLIRHGDKVWTLIRPPRDTLLSFLNYIVTTLESDPGLTRPDTRYWAASLAIAPTNGSWARDVLDGLLPALLRAENLLPIDIACHFLGDGTAFSAIDLLAAGDVEIIDSAKLDLWLEQRFDRPDIRRRNASRSFFKWSDLSPAQQRKVNAHIRQDLALYEIIGSGLNGGISTTGMQLARIAVSHAAPRRLSQIDNATPRTGRAARPILLDPHFVAHPMDKPGSQRLYPGWAEPPLNFRSIETTLQFPLFDTRIRVRYRRHQRGVMNAILHFGARALLAANKIVRSPFKRVRLLLAHRRN